MFDNFFVRSNSLENVTDENGKVTGFRFAVQTCNYRGCILSLHAGYYIKCDGIEYPVKDQMFAVNGKPPRTFQEISKAVWEHWNYADEAYVYVKKNGGLAPGMHTLVVQECIMSQYGYSKNDEQWIENPPVPGKVPFGHVENPSTFELALQQ